MLRDRIKKRDNIEFMWLHTAHKVVGDDMGVTGLQVKAYETNEIKDLLVDGIFIFVGITPNTSFVDCEKDDQGFIITNQKMETSIPGIYAAGDCRSTPLRQVVTAVGDAAIAGFMAEEYISSIEGRSYDGTTKV